MRSTLVVFLAVASCGPANPNKIVDRSSPLAAVEAPHLPIFVETNDGLLRVYLDTGATELISHDQSTLVVSPTSFVRIEDGHYVIDLDGKRIAVPDVKASNTARVSPDRRMVALVRSIDPAPIDLTQPQEEVATIALADGAVRRYPVPTNGPQPTPYLWLQWAKAGDAVLLSHDGWLRLELATGALSPVTKEDYIVQTAVPDPTECPARGIRLVQRSRNQRQAILVVPTASTADPDHLSATTDRVLVTSTDHRGFPKDAVVHFGRPRAEPLAPKFFTPSCEHYVFTLEGGVYVGNVATGKFAVLLEGSHPVMQP